MKPVDSMDLLGATYLADKIKAYWRERGSEVVTWLERYSVPDSSRHHLYFVRSNLVNGAPPPKAA